MTNWAEINQNKGMIVAVALLFFGCIVMLWAVGQYFQAVQAAGYLPALSTPNSSVSMACRFGLGMC